MPLIRPALLIIAACLSAAAHAQTPNVKTPKPPPAKTAPAAAAPAPASGYRIGKVPDWVKPVKAELQPSAQPGGGLGYRILLADTQTLIGADGQQQTYSKVRMTATDGAAVQTVSKAELYFNPAFQTLTVHEAALYRNGVRHDRLKDARIELLRREEQLEQQTLTGVQTLLVVMNDVRVGDVVDVAYTVSGSNPIFKGRFAANYQLAHPAATDQLHLRIEYPLQGKHPLQTRGIRSDAVPERFTEGGRQVLRLVRRDVASIIPEEHVPPWFKVWPSLHVSDFADWKDVSGWAEELFANPGELGPELGARIEAWRAMQLPPEQLVAEVLGFMQDEVRYFSVSLGESSHRPKQPARTFAERLGDCKDKVALLDAVLRQLGFDPHPALISMRRNRGIADYLPSNDEFDHVVTQLQIDGKTYWLDPTIQKQGKRLASRGFVAYGMALVVDPRTTALTAVVAQPGAADGFEFDQLWDVADLRRAPQFTSIVRARGLPAEGWRNAVAAGGVERIAEHMAGAYARVWPGLKQLAAPVVRDDRDANVFEVELKYEMPGFGQYDRASLVVELPALELLDSLVGPREARREMPFLVDQPRSIRQRVKVVAPRRFVGNPPGPVDVGDRHFNLNARYDVDANALTYSLAYERRSDEVLPGDLAGFREQLQSARKLGGITLRLPLLDFDTLRAPLVELERRVQRTLGPENDLLREIVMRQELERFFASEILKLAGDASPLAGSLLAHRAVANNLLNDFGATLADVDRALPLVKDDSELQAARGYALLSLDRADEAISAMQSTKEPRNRAAAARAVGNAQYYQGRFADAEQSFRLAVQDSSGNDRSFGVLWLYLAAERNGGKGKAAIEAWVGGIDRAKWPGVLIHFVAGSASQDDVLREARREKRMERLNLAEAYFYVGQRLLLQGDADGARRMFQRTVEIGALPYREHALAQMELKRAAAR